jgi:hypothetical protein
MSASLSSTQQSILLIDDDELICGSQLARTRQRIA